MRYHFGETTKESQHLDLGRSLEALPWYSASGREASGLCSWDSCDGPGGTGRAIHALDPEFTTKVMATAGMLARDPGQAAWLFLPDTIQGVNSMGLGSILAGDEGTVAQSEPWPAQAPPQCTPTAATPAHHPSHLFPGLLLVRRWHRPQERLSRPRLVGRLTQEGETRFRETFYRWFIQNAEEADHSHSLNASDS